MGHHEIPYTDADAIAAAAVYENVPTDGEMGKAPTSNWAYDHAADAFAHLRDGAYSTINDDDVVSFTPTHTIGIIIIYQRNAGLPATDPGAVIIYDLAASVGTIVIAKTANVETTTGVLDGTTGVDGKFTVSVHTDGKIYLENRLGTNYSIGRILLGR